MADRQSSLLRKLEQDVVNENTPLSTVLQTCLLLSRDDEGARELKDWVRQELNGYAIGAQLPQYRTLTVPVMADITFPGRGTATFHRLAVTEIPEPIRSRVSEGLELPQGVTELESWLTKSDLEGRIRAEFAGGHETAILMTQTASGGTFRPKVHSIYWGLTDADIRRVFASIRNHLTDLLSNLMSNLPREDKAPATPTPAQPINFLYINGSATGSTFNNSQATNDSTSTANASPSADQPTREPAPKEKRRVKIWKWTVDLSIVIAGVCAPPGLLITWLLFKRGG